MQRQLDSVGADASDGRGGDARHGPEVWHRRGGAPGDFSPAARREAQERGVDVEACRQALLRLYDFMQEAADGRTFADGTLITFLRALLDDPHAHAALRPEPQRRAGSYPHQMSGGMRQRVMIAMALACRPSVLIADAPTTALDVTIQAQILDLMEDLQAQLGMALLFITHDRGVVAAIADRVLVMYAGQVVESSEVADLFAHPRMPSTAGLLGSIPRLGRVARRLPAVPGQVPTPSQLPPGCRFSNRCGHVVSARLSIAPPLDTAAPGHDVRCGRWRDLDLAAEARA